MCNSQMLTVLQFVACNGRFRAEKMKSIIGSATTSAIQVSLDNGEKIRHVRMAWIQAEKQGLFLYKAGVY